MFAPDFLAVLCFEANEIPPLAERVNAVSIDRRRRARAGITGSTRFADAGGPDNLAFLGRVERVDQAELPRVAHRINAIADDRHTRKADADAAGHPEHGRTVAAPPLREGRLDGDSVAAGATPFRPV